MIATPELLEGRLVLLSPIDEKLGQISDAMRDPIIPRVAYPGSAIMVYSRQGVGKSRLLVQLAHSLETGERFLGILPILKTGPVVFLQLDMSPLEWAAVLGDARAADMPLQRLYDLRLDADGLNILDGSTQARLQADVARIGAVALIVDAAADAYAAPSGPHDINKLATDVVNAFRRCIPNGLFVYLLHDRKASLFAKPKDVEEDEDAFAGPGGWERPPATSFRLVRQADGTVKLRVTKARFGGPGFKELDLQFDEHGFLHPVLDHKWMLLFWPDCLPATERLRFASGIASLNVAYQDIAERTGASVDAVRKHDQRLRREHGIETPLRRMLNSTAPTCETEGDKEPLSINGLSQGVCPSPNPLSHMGEAPGQPRPSGRQVAAPVSQAVESADAPR